MFLGEKSPSSLSFLLFFPSKNSLPSPFLLFDQALVARLRSLLPVPSSPFSIPLSWLSRAVDLLALTLADAATLISDPSLPGSHRDAIAAHLDSGTAILDACNAVAPTSTASAAAASSASSSTSSPPRTPSTAPTRPSSHPRRLQHRRAHIDRLRRRRLLRFVLHLLASPDSLHRAHEAIVERDRAPRHAINDSAGELARSLAPTVTPRGKISAVRRAIYAVEAVSSLVFGAITAVLGGGEKVYLPGIKISGKFPWVEAFNNVSAAVGDGCAGEVEAVEASVRRLAAVMFGEDDGKRMERLRSAANDAVKAVDEMTDGLDRLSDGVNGLFRVALCTRDAALGSFRIGVKNVNRCT